MTQPPSYCDDLPPLPSVPTVPPSTESLIPGMVMWIVILVAVVAFEIWAVWTGNPTMSETLRRGPGWLRLLVGGGLILLFYHLFIQGRH